MHSGGGPPGSTGICGLGETPAPPRFIPPVVEPAAPALPALPNAPPLPAELPPSSVSPQPSVESSTTSHAHLDPYPGITRQDTTALGRGNALSARRARFRAVERRVRRPFRARSATGDRPEMQRGVRRGGWRVCGRG